MCKDKKKIVQNKNGVSQRGLGNITSNPPKKPSDGVQGSGTSTGKKPPGEK